MQSNSRTTLLPRDQAYVAYGFAESTIAVHSHWLAETMQGAASPAPEREGVTAFIGHVKRASGWVLPRQLRAVALMGGVELDLSKARLAPGKAELDLVAVMGVVTVYVPPEVRVECRGDAITLTNQRRLPDTPLPTATTTIWITGRAIMGAVHVKLVDRQTQ